MPEGAPDSIQIQRNVTRLAQAHARREAQRECCGLLAGREGSITRSFPATNAASAPATRYEIAPQELFQLMRAIREAGLTLMGIYHSHPHGKNEPSPSDIEQAYYPDVAYFIISPLPDAECAVRAFSICDGKARELKIREV
jgi:[CysO sulfur-carrier protein]-S-L-cysteine hydrolase